MSGDWALSFLEDEPFQKISSCFIRPVEVSTFEDLVDPGGRPFGLFSGVAVRSTPKGPAICGSADNGRAFKGGKAVDPPRLLSVGPIDFDLDNHGFGGGITSPRAIACACRASTSALEGRPLFFGGGPLLMAGIGAGMLAGDPTEVVPAGLGLMLRPIPTSGPDCRRLEGCPAIG